METKYYTPEIEEFHVGFEYEEKSSGLWTPQIYNEFSPIINQEIINEHDDRVDTIELYLKCEAIRVKHLDREDIGSLGWEYDDIWRDGGTSLFKKGNDMLAFYGTNRLTNNPLRVIILKDSKQDKHLFDGTIKNKSELKRLLKQLGI
jgi:hypothetical protein